MKHGWAIKRQIRLNGFDHQADYQKKKGNPAQVSLELIPSRIPACMRRVVISSKVGGSSAPIHCQNEVLVVQIDKRDLVGRRLPYVQVKHLLAAQLKQKKIKESIQILASKAKSEKPILTFFEKIPLDTLMTSAY